MKLINYQVEIRDREIGYWKVLRVFEPHWKMYEQLVIHHFLFWKQETLRTTCINLKEETLRCRMRAMRLVYYYQENHTNLRVTKTHQCSDRRGKYHSTKTVWENGVWKDC